MLLIYSVTFLISMKDFSSRNYELKELKEFIRENIVKLFHIY